MTNDHAEADSDPSDRVAAERTEGSPAEESSAAASGEWGGFAETQDALEVENLIESYQILGEWIRFADAKAAVVLTVNGALASILIPPIHEYMQSAQPHPTPWWVALVAAAFTFWLLTMIWSCILAFACILPFRHRGKHPAIGHANHFHAAAISVAYEIDEQERFVENFERMGMSGLKREIAMCMLFDSHISNQKYARVTKAIKMLAMSAVLGLLYLLTIQF